jgi:hypothetical protein
MMGRTHYWIWNSGYLHRIICKPGLLIEKGIKYRVFSFQKKSEYQLFYISIEAFARTKEEAYKMDISTREYEYGRW